MDARLYILVAAVAVLQAFLMLLRGYENARHFRSRCRSPVPKDFHPRVELFVPCKGVEPGFDDLVAAVLNQDYPAYSVTFVVESAGDPAAARLRQLLPGTAPGKAQLVVAGLARDCGQKVHNLSVATAGVGHPVEVLAFADCDTRPTPDWLRRLVAPLHNPQVGAVTGYRWFVPEAADWPTAVLSALNGAVAFLLGNHSRNPVWGGSWAIRRQTFEAAGVRRAWQGALTEDLVVSRVVSRAGLRVAYEPGCLVVSPATYSWRGLLEFARRQYLITRVYSPGLWWWAVGARALFAAAFWGGLALAAWRGAAGEAVWPVLAFPVLLYGLGSARALVRQATVSGRLARTGHSARAARLDVWAHPLLAVADLLFLLSAAVGRQIVWRGIRYRLAGPRRTHILSRPGAGDPAVVPPVARKAA